MSDILTIFLPLLTYTINVSIVFDCLRKKAKVGFIGILVLNCFCLLISIWNQIRGDWRFPMLVIALLIVLVNFASYYKSARSVTGNTGGKNNKSEDRNAA